MLAPVGLAALWFGGIAWLVVISAACAGLLLEWVGLCRRFSSRLAVPIGILGGAVIVGSAVALVWLRADPKAGRDDVLFMVLVVWASDIGAYAAGRAIGGRLLSPLISPAKTWAGALGGLVSAVVGGCLVAAALGPGLASVPGAAAASAVLGTAAQLGDLAESAAKRVAGVKDSGWLIPGHGGLLDRLDGTVAAALAALLLAALSGRGVVFWR